MWEHCFRVLRIGRRGGQGSIYVADGKPPEGIRLTERFAARFSDRRRPELVEHEVGTLVMQRVVGVALGYEDLVDHDQLRHDPVLATLAGKLEARGARAARRWRASQR